MKHAARLIAAALSWSLLLGLTACTDPKPTPEEPAISAIEAYNTAKAQLLAAPNRLLNYTITNTYTTGGQSYTESTTGTASYSDFGTDNMVAIIDEDLLYGSVSAEYLLSFCNGQSYSRISGSIFGAALTAADFVAEQLPAVLMDPVLYGSITRTVNADGSVIHFSQPNALENWVDVPKNTIIMINNIAASAILDKDGVLVQSNYNVDYTCGNLSFSLKVTVKCSTPAKLELSTIHPEHPDDYAELSCMAAPKLLLRAAGNILSSGSIEADTTETIYSQIIPLTRQRQSQISLSGRGQTLAATLINTTTVKDYRDQPEITTQVYDFFQGVCSLTVNDGTPSVQPDITASGMRTSLEDSLLSALFAIRYLAGATITEQENCYRLDLTGNESYCSDLTRDLSSFLNLSLDGATSHKNTSAGGYLCIDKLTGLPVEMGMYFSRTHIIGDIPYVLSYQLDQAIDFP